MHALWHVYVGDEDAAEHCLEELTGPELRRLAESTDTLSGIIRDVQQRRGGKGFVAHYLTMPRPANRMQNQ